MTGQKKKRASKSNTCRWKGCREPRVEGSCFCEAHCTPPPSSAFPGWIRELPFAIRTGLASSVLYDLLKYFGGWHRLLISLDLSGQMGAPPLRFLQGWVARLPISYAGFGDGALGGFMRGEKISFRECVTGRLWALVVSATSLQVSFTLL